MKKLIASFIGLTVLFGNFGVASAMANTWHLNLRNADDDGDITYNLDRPTTEHHVMIWDANTSYPRWVNGGDFKTKILDQYGFVDTPTFAYFTGNQTLINADVAADLSGIHSSLNGMSGSFDLAGYMANPASTTPLVATNSMNGFMSASMFTKLNSLSSTSTQPDWNQSSTTAKDFIKNKPSIPHIERIRATTNTSGAYTFTFATPFNAIPVVSSDVENTTVGITQVYISAISTSSVSVQTARATNVVGVLTLQTSPQLTVHITAIEQ